MGSISGGTGTGFDPTDMTTSDMVLSGDFDDMEDVNAILEMNREATNDQELNIGASGGDPIMDDDLIDFSNPTRDEMLNL